MNRQCSICGNIRCCTAFKNGHICGSCIRWIRQLDVAELCPASRVCDAASPSDPVRPVITTE
ncbi:MAG: hypothetical protein ACOYJJ_01875 [Anaerovoracaceae bacterium]|jgi:hypothetical protein